MVSSAAGAALRTVTLILRSTVRIFGGKPAMYSSTLAGFTWSLAALLCRLHRPFAQLGRRQILLVRGEVPDMAEWVLHRARAVAVELVLDRPDQLGACGHGALRHSVDILHVEVDMDRRAAARLGTHELHLRIFVREHHARAADPNLGVANLAL